ncbi:tRNA pseudouridine synthase, partial [Nadsonia fulvescens var. elongata DSM 6958]
YDSWRKEDLIKRLTDLENGGTGEFLKKVKKVRKMDFSKYTTRHVALKFAYLGWNYNGLAIQGEPTRLPTIESVILEALTKCCLIEGDFHKCEFSRCGRTDKGVSAMSQIISIKVRSKLTPEQQEDPDFDLRELDYINILNSLLPDDIRVYSVALRLPKGFDARFSCTHRDYRYFFPGQGLDIDAMREAASYYLGLNDFRNFCKVDVSKQITNFCRTILKSEIHCLDGRDNPSTEKTYYYELRGSAFLWHQVRSMMAILFLVGQGYEKPTIVKDLLNVEKFPCRPLYQMASEIPLVLYDCGYPEMEWKTVKEYKGITKLQESIYNAWYDHHIKTTMSLAMKNRIFGD